MKSCLLAAGGSAGGSLTDRRFTGDGTIDDLPWASVFDPAANARALSAIQAEGFRAASRIVDRFVRAVEPDSEGVATNGNTAVNAGDRADGINELERLTRAWWSMTGQLLLKSVPATGRHGAESVRLDVNDPGARRELNLEASVGHSAECEVWLHNTGLGDHGEVRLRVSDLLSHDGDQMTAAAIRIDPDVVSMPARSSRGVAITVAVAHDARPGVYRGTLLGSGNSGLYLPVTLTVRLADT